MRGPALDVELLVALARGLAGRAVEDLERALAAPRARAAGDVQPAAALVPFRAVEGRFRPRGLMAAGRIDDVQGLAGPLEQAGPATVQRMAAARLGLDRETPAPGPRGGVERRRRQEVAVDHDQPAVAGGDVPGRHGGQRAHGALHGHVGGWRGRRPRIGPAWDRAGPRGLSLRRRAPRRTARAKERQHGEPGAHHGNVKQILGSFWRHSPEGALGPSGPAVSPGSRRSNTSRFRESHPVA